jgi:hypothetical protein
MSRAQVHSQDIVSNAKSVQESLINLEALVTNFQTDLDTNEFMKESLDWDYLDVRKTVDLLTKQVNGLVYDAELALQDEEYSEDDEDEDEEDC